MKYLFSVIMFINCVLAFDFAIRFGWISEKKYIENRLVAVFCCASALWSGSFAALFLQTDTEMAYICRSIGMIGTFLYLIVAQMIVCNISGIKKRWRYLFDGISYIGIFVYFLTIKKGEVVYQLTGDGMTYYFKPGFCNNAYIVYVVILSINIFAVIVYMLRFAKAKRIQAFGRKFLLVEGLIFLGMIFDTVFPLLGFGAIPGSSITQFWGMVVAYNAVYQVNRSRVNITNMSEFIYYSLAMPVLVYDADRRIQIMNDAASSFLGVSQNVVETGKLGISQLFDIEEEETFAFSQKRKDVDAVCQNNQVYCSLSVNKIHDPYGDIIGYIIIVTDLSERIKTVQRLEEAIKEADSANQAKSTFLANISHEIRTPMNVIIGFSELVLKMELEEQVREYIEDIKDSSENLLAIINDLLDISKIESGKMELVCSDYYIGGLFHDVFLIINAQAKKKGLDFHMTVDKDMPNKLYGDKIRIRGVLINLLNNAVKYTKQGTVSLEAKVLNKRDDIVSLEFIVTDTGAGIRQEEQGRLFESFSQVDRKVHYGVEGTGLGLAIVKGYVTLMNGDVKVESVYGEGSVFTAVIEQKIIDASPIDKFEGKDVKDADDFCIGDMKIPDVRVLVVDDNQINLKVAGSSLGYYGLKVDTASSGMEAIELCRQNRYDMVFMDQMMPQMDGIEAMKQIRKLDFHYDHGGACKIIVLTANAVSGVREQLVSEGFDEYLGKPINFKQLERLFRRFIPEERIQSGTKQSIETEEELEMQKLQEMLPELELKEGILYCGGNLTDYLDVLQLVYRRGEKQLEELAELQKQGKYSEYTIRVHGMKGSARSIGAKKVSDLAKAQEKAGKEGDFAYIDAHMDEFCREYRMFLEQIRGVLEHYRMSEPAGETAQAGISEEPDFMQILKGIRQSMDAFDFAGAAKRVREVPQERLPEQYREDFAKLSQWMDDMEEDKMRELMNKYIGDE